MRRRLLALGMVAALVGAGAVACSSGGGTGSALRARPADGPGTTPGPSPSAPRRRLLGNTDPAKVIDFSVVLRVDRRRAQRFVEEVNDPSSPRYGRFLSAREYGRRFGISDGDLAGVRSTLSTAGFAVHDVFPQRTGISLSGTAGRIDAFFATRLADFRDTDGRRYVAPVREPVVPDALRPSVTGVAGLNGLPAPVPLAIPNPKGLFPDDAAKAYNATPLRSQGILGQGQTIAIVSFGSFRNQDVQSFDREVGLTAPSVGQSIEHVPVDGGNRDATGEVAQEVNLDVDVVRGMAPQAKILNYEVPLTSTASFTRGLGDAINKIVADGRANIVSISYGLCDAQKLSDGSPFLSPSDRKFTEQALAAGTAAGLSVFVAAGDTGAFGCQRFDLNDIQAVPLWPGDSPSVISVGGTLLSVRRDGTYLQEAGWEDILSGGGTGGGVNPDDAMPSFQQSLANPGNTSGQHRLGPDVAASADPDSGFFTVAPDKSGQSVGGPVGGTSAATPFWAASMILIQQFAQQQGVKKLPFMDPVLYGVAKADQSYDGVDSPDEPFHDVTIGGNRKDDCKVGYDLATGLGSPNVTVLAQDVTKFVKANGG
jgi:subtilase family serine protease